MYVFSMVSQEQLMVSTVQEKLEEAAICAGYLFVQRIRLLQVPCN